jgi:hypothetical protein
VDVTKNPNDQAQAIFSELAAHSWQRYDEAWRNQRIDDVLAGAVIAAMVKDGYSLIGLNSDGVSHHLRFENLDDMTRLIFRLTHLTESLTDARVQGHLGSVVLGYGMPIGKVATVWAAFESEAKSLFADTPEPGIITFDADMSSGYIYAQVCLLLDLDRYIDKDFTIRLDVLALHLRAIVDVLRRYLQGRLAGSN